MGGFCSVGCAGAGLGLVAPRSGLGPVTLIRLGTPRISEMTVDACG
jgi:hypothetical protein